MQTYLVYISKGGENVTTCLPNTNFQLAEGLWAVGSSAETPADLSEALGIGGGVVTGVVVSMETYYGYYDNALWQRLEAWSRTDD